MGRNEICFWDLSAQKRQFLGQSADLLQFMGHWANYFADVADVFKVVKCFSGKFPEIPV